MHKKLVILFAFIAVAFVLGQDLESEDAGVSVTTDASTGASDGGDCEDLTSDCSKNAYECSNPQYKPLMCSMCKKTCNFCASTNGTDPCAGVVTIAPPPTTPPTAGPDQCIDTASDCAKNSFECTNSLYKPLMCKYCKKTCNICDDPACLA